MIWTIIGIVEVKNGQILSFCKYYHNCLIHTVDWVIWWIVIMPIKWNYKLELCSRLETQWMYNHAFWYASYQYSLLNIHDHMLLLWVLLFFFKKTLNNSFYLLRNQLHLFLLCKMIIPSLILDSEMTDSNHREQCNM